MSSRVVVRGRLRVDARKAVAKLREHQLLDPHHYVLELLRAAVLSDAKYVELRHDADDLRVAWCGKPLEASQVVRLLDHVLVGGVDAEGQRLRLLAMGVNAALGLDPAFVDVFVVGSAGSSKVRFEPSLLEADETSEPALSRGATPGGEEPPPGTVHVHLRRRLGWGVFRRAVLGGRLPELEVVRRCAADLGIPVHLGTAAAPTEPHGDVLGRVPIELPGVAGIRLRRAELRVLRAGAEACLVFLEHGVVMARYARAPAGLTACAPIHIVIDAAPLPANASRSEVRTDSPLFERALAAGEAAFETAVAGLCASVAGGDEVVEGFRVTEGASPEELDDALGTLVSAVVLAQLHGSVVASAGTKRLLELPVLSDACGAPLAYASVLGWGRAPVAVLDADAPVDAVLSPWMRRVIWRRGRAAELALDSLPTRDGSELVVRAQGAAGRRRQHLGHAAGPTQVPASPSYLCHADFRVAEGDLAGLEGQAALHSGLGREARVHLFYEGRLLAVLVVPPPQLDLPVELAIRWDRRLRPTFDFDSLEEGPPLRAAMGHGFAFALLQLRGLADELLKLDSERLPHARAVLRKAVAAALVAAKGGPSLLPPQAGLRAGGPLDRAAVWPATDGSFVSLATLGRLARTHGAVLVAPPGSRGEAALGRPVLAVDRQDLALILDALSVTLGSSQKAPVAVPYQRGLRPLPVEPAERTRLLAKQLSLALTEQGADGTSPRVEFEQDSARGLVAVAWQPLRVQMHAGVAVSTEVHRPIFGPAVIVIDDDRALPDPSWSRIMSPGAKLRHGALELELLLTVVAALHGDEDALRRIPAWKRGWQHPGDMLRRYLLMGLAAVGGRLARAATAVKRDSPRPGILVLTELRAALEALPLLNVLGPDGRPTAASPAQVLQAHPPPGPIPCLENTPKFETLDWRPLLLATQADREGAQAWAGDRLVSGVAELPARRRRAEAEAIGRALLERPAEPAGWFAHSVRASVPSYTWTDEARGVAMEVAFAPTDDRSNECPVAVLYEGRHVFSLLPPGIRLPLVARLDSSSTEVFTDGFRALSPEGLQALEAGLVEAAHGLAAARLAAEAPPCDFGDEQLTILVAQLLGADPQRREDLARAALDARWPTARGEAQPLGDLRRHDRVVYASTRRHLVWHGPEGRKSDLDDPVLLLPGGHHQQAMLAALAALDVELRDVSDALDALQQTRAGAGTEVPRLAGDPQHPLLRVTLKQLGVTAGVGEAELYPGPGAEIHLLTPGVPQGRALVVDDLAVPTRAVVRVDSLRTSLLERTLASQLRAGLDRLLVRLMPQLDELPIFLRQHLRDRVKRKLAAGQELAPTERQSPIFQGIAGDWYSLASVLAEHEELGLRSVWFTTQTPESEGPSYGRPVLLFPSGQQPAVGAAKGEQEFLHHLRRLVPLRNMTRVLMRDAEAAKRRDAPPRTEFRIGESVRGRCLLLEKVAADGVRGELGILAPEAAELRGIHVAFEGRPLGALDDGEGWPLHGVVDCDYARPNRFFSGLRSPRDRARLVAGLRALAQQWLQDLTVGPADALAQTWLQLSSQPLREPDELADPGPTVTLLGHLWLPARWPASPRVRVRGTGPTDSVWELPLRRLMGSPHLDHALPLAGRLLVRCDDASEDLQPRLASIAFEHLGSMIVSLPEGAEAERYRFHYALLGGELDKPPSTPIAGGGVVSCGQILAALADRGELWWTGHDGDVDGAFPDEAPPFVLLGQGPGLAALAVLEAIAAPGVLRELGGHATPTEMRDVPALSDEAERAAALAGTGADASWFEQLVRGVRRIWDPDIDAGPNVEPLARALAETLARLDLDGDYSSIEVVGRGRPIRVTRECKLALNARHASLAPGRDVVSRERFVTQLAAAAAAELNRAREGVTRVTEQQTLLKLLLES